MSLRLRSIEDRIKKISGDEPLDFDISPALGKVVYQPRPIPSEYLWVFVKTFKSIGLYGNEPFIIVESIDELKKYCEDPEGYSRKDE